MIRSYRIVTSAETPYIEATDSSGKTVLVGVADKDLLWVQPWQVQKNEFVSYHQTGRSFHLSRTILNPAEGEAVTFLNRDYKDCRRSNLTVISSSVQNLISPPHETRRTSSPYKGVSQHKSGRYFARIGFNGKTHHLGTFDTDVDAAHAYDLAAFDFAGPIAYLNFPDRVPGCPDWYVQPPRRKDAR